MQVIRYNFETNSSSMHSLVCRKEGGRYSKDELGRTEELSGEPAQDVILVLDEPGTYTTKEMKNSTWCWDNKLTIRGYHLDYQSSAMEVLSSFGDKLNYVLAHYNTHNTDIYRPWEDDYKFDTSMVEPIVEKYLSGVVLDVRANGDRVSINNSILDDFLNTHGITVEEFLVQKRYAVIIDFEEFCNMRHLGLVDESKILEMFGSDDIEPRQLKFDNGVWKLNEGDINFGRTPFRVLGTPEGKARYALADARSGNIEEITEILREVYPELVSIELPKDRYSEDGVDHGYAESYGGIIPTDISLRDFILDRKYVIVVDGDEYCIFKNFVEAGMLNKNEFENPEKEREYEEEQGEEIDIGNR